jgi:hypothetical protein
MKRFYPYLKNKFILAFAILSIYTLFLDENDLFTMISNANKLRQLEVKKIELNEELKDVRSTLNKLTSIHEVERFAREKKYFKKDDEDLFVIFTEGEK